jgi:hypothetical protein
MSAVKHALRRSWRALLAYLVFTAWGLGCMVVSVLLILGEHAFSAVTEMNVLIAVAGIVVAGLLGHLAGNMLGLLRLRVWVMGVLALAFFIGATLSSAALGPFAGFLVVAGIAAAGGFLAVGSSEIFASWVPLTYAVGAAVLWMNTHGKVSVWLTGAKFAVWDAITFGFLSGAVVLFLVFLLQRHALALTLWQDAARPGGTRDDLHARAGKGSVGCLVALCGVVLVATAILSPFLFRTERVEGGTHATSTTTTTEGQCVPSSGTYSGPSSGTSGGTAWGGSTSSTASAPSCGGESVGGTTVGGNSVGGNSVAGNSVGGTSVGATSVGGTSVGGKSVGGTSVGGKSVGGESVGGKSVGGESVGAKSVGGESVGGKSVGGESIGTKSVGGTTTGGTSTGGSSTGGTSTGGTGTGEATTTPEQPKTAGPSTSSNAPPDLSKPDLENAKAKSIDAAKLGLIVMRWLVMLLGLLLVLAIFFRPIRRAILLRHLEYPLWSTTPTRRIQNLWLRAIIALDDAGITARPDEDPVRLAQRAIDELGKQHGSVPGGLEQAAQIVERVEYAGRGLAPDEEAKMRNAVLALVGYVGRNTGFGRKVAQGWSSVPFA